MIYLIFISGWWVARGEPLLRWDIGLWVQQTRSSSLPRAARPLNLISCATTCAYFHIFFAALACAALLSCPSLPLSAASVSLMPNSRGRTCTAVWQRHIQLSILGGCLPVCMVADAVVPTTVWRPCSLVQPLWGCVCVLCFLPGAGLGRLRVCLC